MVVAASPATRRFAPVAFWPDTSRRPAHLAEAAEKALAERRGVVLRRQAEDRNGAGERYDLAYPIQSDGRVYAVVALDVTARPDAELQAVLRALQWGAGWLELVVHRLDAAGRPLGGQAGKERLQAALDLVASALGQERFYAAATSFVTAVATRLACDRVSVGFIRRGHARVLAVSHSAQFGTQTNVIRAVGAAMDEAIDQQATVVWPPPATAAAVVTRAHEELGQSEHAAAVCTVPLADGPRIVGALTLDRPLDRPFDRETVELCEAVAAIAGPVLELHRRDDRWLLAKAADGAHGHLAALIGPRHVALKLGVVAVVAVVAFLAFAGGDYRVSARTVMEASVRRAAVAPFQGYIREAPLRAGALVREGDVLAVLDDRELRLERAKLTGQQEQLLRQYSQALAKRDAAQVQIVTAQVDQARAQLALLEDHLARTRVTAAFDGVIVTGDLTQALGAPVERGQVLFEIAPLEAYRVVLQVDERDVSEVVLGQRGNLILTAWPTDPLPFTVTSITPVSTAREGRNYFRVEATLEQTPERLRPGMEGVGKVEIGRRRLVWVWTHQAVDWIRLKLWTWLP